MLVICNIERRDFVHRDANVFVWWYNRASTSVYSYVSKGLRYTYCVNCLFFNPSSFFLIKGMGKSCIVSYLADTTFPIPFIIKKTCALSGTIILFFIVEYMCFWLSVRSVSVFINRCRRFTMS